MFCGLGDIFLGGENIINRINRVMIVTLLVKQQPPSLFLKVGEKLDIEAFQTVTIEDADGSLLFGGRVEGYPESTETMAGSQQKIICRDWSVECGYRQVIEHFSDWVISDIYKSLIQKYLPEHTTNNVCETTETATLRFNGISVSQCLNILADLCGWTWKVSANRDHYFGETFLEKVIEDITDEVVDTAKGRITNFQKDYTILANRVWVEGGEGLARNFSEQFVKLENLEKAAEPLLRENYPYQIPVWYASDGVKVFAIYDKGDEEIENGKLVQLDCGANADIAGQNVYMPTAENFAGSSYQFAPTGSTTVTSSAPLVKLSTARNVVTDYDAIFVSDPTENSAGGYVYIGDLERNKVDLTKGPWRYGFIGDRLKQNIDPDGTPKVKD
ncbi:MAG: hypothetical protein KAH30_00800, partial [Caldisericia bacterium]|nr:hypothetical protein [Caldisericia bacterium]